MPSVPKLRLAFVKLDLGVIPHFAFQRRVDFLRAFSSTTHVHVVLECEQAFNVQQILAHMQEGAMLATRTQCRHEGVTLLSTLSLPHLMCDTQVVCRFWRALDLNPTPSSPSRKNGRFWHRPPHPRL